MKFELLINTEIAEIDGMFRFYHQSKAFILLIDNKMPTIVGILTFMSMKNFMLSRIEHEIFFITSGPVLAYISAVSL